LEVLKDIFTLAQRGAVELMNRMVGQLYPSIIQSQINRAREIIEKSDPKTVIKGRSGARKWMQTN
jgi:hypothetical protein